MSNKFRIAFYAGKCLPITANTLNERPLGGTETGIIRVAEILHARGHEVTVYSSATNPPDSAPKYLPAQQVQSMGEVDAFIMVLEWWPAFFRAKAKRQFFWTGDSYDQFVNFGLGDKRVAARIDAFLATTNWHAKSLCEVSGFPANKAFVVGNGVHLPYFDGTEQRKRKRLIYTSAPYRGLDLVPKIYSRIREKHPDVELHIFSGLAVYDTEKKFEGPEADHWKELRKILEALPGCTVHENVKQKDLAREMMKSSIYFYPNTFVETCCIGAMEAQAAGCVVVTSARGGLPEVVGPAGFSIPGNPGDPAYEQTMTDIVHRLLEDDELYSKMSQTALQRAKDHFSWEKVADRFEQLFNMTLV